MNQGSALEYKRHTLAHLLAQAVLEHHPEAKLTLGPAIENGFYYDIDFGADTITDADLPTIEKTMRRNLPSWEMFEKIEVSPAQAKKIFAGNSYKLELIDEIVSKGEPITLYYSGSARSIPSLADLLRIKDKGLRIGFVDLCRGGHSEHPHKDIKDGSWKLDRIAGAYWRGNEKNKMLTRIYGLAFNTAKELEEYEKQTAEAEKRDHRKLGKELRIFTFDDDVGPGLPLWLPNGTVMIDELEALAKEKERQQGYRRVRTPHIAKESLYLQSGHLPYYADSMYPPMEYEGGKYYLKAMNCPHHHKIYLAEPRSYRDLPLRLAEYGTCYRQEKSGELFGLMRVRSMQMNDAHIYCTEEQFSDEFKKVSDLYVEYFKIFGIKKYMMRFSTHDPKRLGEKFVNEPALWEKTEAMVRKTLRAMDIPFSEVPNEAAFYGPKIDVQIWCATGREFTLATNQVDFAQPRRFNLTYTDEHGKQQTPLVIHRAPLSTHERLIGFLLEHYAGAFPFWLAPVQIKILPVSEKFLAYAKEVQEKLLASDIRSKLDSSNETLGKKVRSAKLEKVPYFIVIGEKEESGKTLTLESRVGETEKQIPIELLNPASAP